MNRTHSDPQPEFKFCILPEVVEHCKEMGEDPAEFLPFKAEDRSSGWDVRCAEPGGVTLNPGCYLKIPLGIKVFSPENWWLRLVPRSSTFIKRHIHSLYGTIDESYEGQLYFCGQYVEDACAMINVNHLKRIEFGERIGQLIPMYRETMIVSEINEEEFSKLTMERNATRGQGGFGSSGAK